MKRQRQHGTRPSGPGTSTPSASRINHRLWERVSDSYEKRHAESLSGRRAASWGLFRIPESQLQLLGNVRGQKILELGCGAGRWMAALAAQGARPVGIDFSRAHLRHAQKHLRPGRRRPPLVEGSAESLPFQDATFDMAFCDWGALTFADPSRTIPEAARVLRPGGLLVFSTASPFRSVAERRTSYAISPKLRYDYFGLDRLDYPTEVNFQRTYAGWVELFRENGLELLRLVEPPAPRRSTTTYLGASALAWARRWPMEAIWQLRRASERPRVARRLPRRESRSPRG